jgi:hypothetical protein
MVDNDSLQGYNSSPCKWAQWSEGRGMGSCYRAVAILLLNTLLVFACFELAARGVFTMARVLATPTAQLVGEGNPRETVSYYGAQEWAKQYWDEFRRSRTQRYYPYVGWRRAPFTGHTIAIDQDGVRVTPGADCRANALTVFTFGASAMWGTGAPNWGTIPAYVQQGLAKRQPRPVCVRNFAETGYVLTQDVLMLLVQLQSGHVPAVVLFYDLDTDIYAAYQSGRAGGPMNLEQLVARFEGPREPSSWIAQLRRTSTYAFIDELVGKLTIAHPPPHEPLPRKLRTYESMGIDAAQLSAGIVQTYLANYTIVSALAHTYGFQYFFFLPPSLALGNKPLTAEEQAMKERAESDAALAKLQTAVYQSLERASAHYPHLYSLVHIFDHCESLMWIDEGHVTPIGNHVIAESMLDVMEARSRHESLPRTSHDGG